MTRFRNAAGPRIAELRKELGLTQDQLAAKLQNRGLPAIDRVGVVKIEKRMRSIFDYELVVIAAVLKVEPSALLPSEKSMASDLENLRQGLR